jgi:hypothetical protein
LIKGERLAFAFLIAILLETLIGAEHVVGFATIRPFF